MITDTMVWKVYERLNFVDQTTEGIAEGLEQVFREDLAELLAGASDLDKVKAALIREYSIRHAMAETGEDRQTIIDAMDAVASMDQEAVLELTSGAPTTLADGLQAYIETLDTETGRDGTMPTGAVLSDLHALLTYPWPEEEATIATHGANASVGLRLQEDGPDHTAIYVGGQLVGRFEHDGGNGVDDAAEAVHRAVLSRVIGDRPHHIQLNAVQTQDMRDWLARPNGALSNGDRFSLNAVWGGGVLIRTRPYTSVVPPQSRA